MADKAPAALDRPRNTRTATKGSMMDKAVLLQGFIAQARALREFGYPDVTKEMVAAAHADWVAGKEPADIIARFCVSAFEERPRIFGDPK